MLRKIVRSKITWSVLTLFAIALVAFVYWFAPHKLFIDTTVEEAAPTVAVPAAAPGTPAPSAPAAPQVLARGDFISHEHATTGTVVLLRLPDGNRVVRLENLDTSDGPDLRVWITDAPVLEGKDGWFVFDDGAYQELGKLKGNKGSQNYDLPASVDVAKLNSVTIWCDRFNVSFGAALLRSA